MLLRFFVSKAVRTAVFLILAVVLAIGFVFTNTAHASVYVHGYTKKNGTYVAPYYRSNPDGNPYNNYSFPGNTNPYTGKTATGNPDTYLANYYKNSSGSASDYSSDASSYVSAFKMVTGGYYIGDTLYCDFAYYKSNNACVQTPANSYAYGGDTFYCDYGYTKTESGCMAASDSDGSLSLSGYANTASAVASDLCPAGTTKTIYGCQLNLTTPSCTEYGSQAYYDTSTSKCRCNPGYYVNQSTNRCDTPNNACQALNGPNSYGEGASCFCNAGYTYSDTQKTCIANRETRKIKGYLKNMADFTSDSCASFGLASQADVTDCDFYRLNKDMYVWKTI